MAAPHILIIDDSLTESHIFKSLLEREGYQVSVACNGQEGIQVAKARQPDVILMDVVMPLVNGFQATRELSRSPDTSHIPVIVCSAKDTDTDRLWAMRQGAKAYLVKPIVLNEFLKVIGQFAKRDGVYG